MGQPQWTMMHMKVRTDYKHKIENLSDTCNMYQHEILDSLLDRGIKGGHMAAKKSGKKVVKKTSTTKKPVKKSGY